MARLRLLLLCGGQSEEHEVSLLSARSVLAAVGDTMQVTPLVIDRSGRLLEPESSLRALAAGSAPAGSGRSEERRGGKGWRCRGAPWRHRERAAGTQVRAGREQR